MIKNIMVIASVLEVSLMAHAGIGSVSGLNAGLIHPIHGLDHILTMLAVGFWAAQMGGRALWALPVSFMSMMTIGAIFGWQGMAMPYMEEAIVVSVLLLGLFILFRVNISVAMSTVIIAVFALFHGFSHGVEMPLSVGSLEYAIGFVLTTGVLHLLGIIAAVGMQKMITYGQIRRTVMGN